jgi:hypothetical protein
MPSTIIPLVKLEPDPLLTLYGNGGEKEGKEIL